MVVLLLHLILGLFLWTLFSLTGKGYKHKEIKANVDSIKNDLANLLKNVSTLIRLLIQDLLVFEIKDSSFSSKKVDMDIKDNEQSTVTEENYATEIATITKLQNEEGRAYTCTSQETINLINEQEARAA